MSYGREEYVNLRDEHKAFLRIWDDVREPKAIIQIFHGMAEHSKRYDHFARFLNSKGFIVYADDHRGHGKTAEKNGILGYLGDDGFNKIVEDKYEITNLIKVKYPNMPIYIFAHSFGSFIGQEYIIRYSNEIQGIVLSGSAKNDGIDIKFGKIVAKLQSKISNEEKRAKVIDKFAFGGFNKNVKKPKSDFAWLTRDELEQKKYEKDKYCAYVATINFYKELFGGLSELYKIEKLEKINKNLHILVLAGDKDPVGKNGKSVKRLFEQYNNLGIKSLNFKLYEDGRHELLNEINKKEVYEFLNSWINNSYESLMVESIKKF